MLRGRFKIYGIVGALTVLLAIIAFFACQKIARDPNLSADAVNDTNKQNKMVTHLTREDLLQLPVSERVEYELTHPRGFSASNKRELPHYNPPSKIETDPFREFYPCDKDQQSVIWGDYTDEERMLAEGYEIVKKNGDSFEPKKIVKPLDEIGCLLMYFYVEFSRLPADQRELLTWHVTKIMSPQPEGYEPYDVGEALDAFFDSITSPVTGGIIDWTSIDYSSGNGFVTVINAIPEAMQTERGLHEAMWENNVSLRERQEPVFDNALFVYCRAYGDSGVINYWTKGWFR